MDGSMAGWDGIEHWSPDGGMGLNSHPAGISPASQMTHTQSDKAHSTK